MLFICSMNKWRSPTAEKIYNKRSSICARSAGTSSKAKHTVSLADMKWADIIMVMENKHKQRLKADYPEAMRFCAVHVLDIPDNYKFMDPELICELESCIDPIIHDFISDK